MTVSSVPIESGIKYFHQQRRAFIFGSNTLEWLLSLSPRDWSSIYVAQSSGDDVLSAKIHARMTVSVMSQPDKWATDVSSCDVLLGAGTKASMAPILQGVSGGVPAILVLSRRRRTKGLHHVYHRQVGGATAGLDFFKRAIGRTLVSLQQCHANWVIS